MTAIDHTLEDLDQLAATYRFLALITELRARARAANAAGEEDRADRLEGQAAFLARQLPITPPLCGGCATPLRRPRRNCVALGPQWPDAGLGAKP